MKPSASVRASLAALLVAAWVAGGCGSSPERRGAGLPEKEQVYVVGREGAGLRQLTHDDRFHGAPAWSPDGRVIASATTGVRRTDGGAVDTPGAIELVASDGSRARQLRPGGYPSQPAWLDSRRLAFLSREEGPDPGTRAAIVVIGASGRVWHRTSLGPVTEDAAWSPSRRVLAFVRGCQCTPRVGPQPDIVLVGDDGGGEKRLTRSQETEHALAWAPNGRALLFTSGAGLWTVSRSGGAPRRIAGGLVLAFAAWSPDARRLVVGAVTARGDRRFHLYALPATGGQLRQLTDEVATAPPAWSPDGTLIAFVNVDGDTIEAMRPDGSHRSVARLPGAEIRGLAWSPDSRHVAFTARRKPPED